MKIKKILRFLFAQCHTSLYLTYINRANIRHIKPTTDIVTQLIVVLLNGGRFHHFHQLVQHYVCI